LGRGKDTIAEKSTIRSKLFPRPLRHEVLRYRSNMGCSKAIIKLIDLWQTHSRSGHGHRYRALIQANLTEYDVFQISIKNANEFIAPPAIISHAIRNSVLLDRLGIELHQVFHKSSFRKFQGKADNSLACGVECAHGALWAKIAETVAKYKRDKGFEIGFVASVDWLSSYLDYRALKTGLESVDKIELLHLSPLNDPSQEFSPLFWWRILRRMLNLGTEPKSSLFLGNLFSVLCSEQTTLLARAHSADTDIEVLIKVMEFFINSWQGKPAKDRIDGYLAA
jgi:hypothetical protein